MSGWVKMYRQFDESEIAHKPPHVREIFLWLLRNANHKDTKECKRGQCIRRISDIQDGLCWYSGYRKNIYSKGVCEYAMNTLRELNMVLTSKTTRGLVVTICNYDKYQHQQDTETNTETNKERTRNEQSHDTINKNVKNDKNVKEYKIGCEWVFSPRLKNNSDYIDTVRYWLNTFPEDEWEKFCDQYNQSDRIRPEITKAISWLKEEGQFRSNIRRYLNNWLGKSIIKNG